MTEIDLEQRRWIGRGIRFGLVALTVVLVISWFSRKRSAIPGRITIPHGEVAAVAPPLGPGDVQIISQNGAVELVLRGNEVLAGLSPAKVAEVKAEMERSSERDTSGFGGLIASTVKRGVAGAIGAHMVYPVSDIRDINYDGGRIVMHTKSGGRVQLFDKSDSGRQDLFAPQDAERFVAAVRARMAQQH
jgi:hypothetical protein